MADNSSSVDKADKAYGTCMWDDVSCKTNDWGTRLIDTEYIGIPFAQWGNIVVIIWTILLVFSTKFVFSIPFLLWDKKTKSTRQALRIKRKEKRDAKKRRMRKLKAKVATLGGGGLAGLVKAASSGTMASSGEKKSTTDGTSSGQGSSDKSVELHNMSGADLSLEVEDRDEEEVVVWRSFDHQIVLTDNKAISIAYSFFVVSVMLACSGTRIPLDYDDDPLQSLIDCLLYSTLTYVLLCAACLLQSKLLLMKLNVREQLLRRNKSVAITFSGIALASAVNLRASMMGSPSSRSFAETLGVTIMYFVFGQISVLAFGCVFQVATVYDDQKEAKADNTAAGIKWASNLVALSVVSSAPIERTSEIASFWAFTALGSVFLLVYDMAVCYFVVPGNLMHEISRDRNWGYALICAAILLTTAISFEAILKDLPCPGSDAWDEYIASFEVPGADAGDGAAAAAAAATNSSR